MRPLAAVEDHAPSSGGIVAAWGTHATGNQHCWKWSWPPGTWPAPKPFLSGFPMHTSARSVFLRYSRTASVTSRTAVYGPVCAVVWQGAAGNRRPHADNTGGLNGSTQHSAQNPHSLKKKAKKA